MIFNAGQTLICGQRHYRILEGNRRKNGDMILEVCANGWHRPLIANTLLEVAFKYQVEENNYPPALGFEGGQKLLNRIYDACLNGWEQAAQRTNQEAEAARIKREQEYIQGQLGFGI